MNEGTLQERNRGRLTRRRFSAGLCLGLLSVIAGCGGDVDEPASTTTPAAGNVGTASTPTTESTGVATWDVVPNGALALAPGASFDLVDTLPTSVPRGGVFEVDPGGAPLPAGITLAPVGLLLVKNGAAGGTARVIFRYVPPA